MSVLAVQKIHGAMKALNGIVLAIPAHKEPHILPSGAADLALKGSKALLTAVLAQAELFARCARRARRL